MLSYSLCCEWLLFLLHRHTAANIVISMTVLSTAPMMTPPTHGSGVPSLCFANDGRDVVLERVCSVWDHETELQWHAGTWEFIPWALHGVTPISTVYDGTSCTTDETRNTVETVCLSKAVFRTFNFQYVIAMFSVAEIHLCMYTLTYGYLWWQCHTHYHRCPVQSVQTHSRCKRCLTWDHW